MTVPSLFAIFFLTFIAVGFVCKWFRNYGLLRADWHLLESLGLNAYTIVYFNGERVFEVVCADVLLGNIWQYAKPLRTDEDGNLVCIKRSGRVELEFTTQESSNE